MGLLSFLFGGNNSNQAPPVQPRWQTDQQGYVTPTPAQAQPGALVQSLAQASPAAPSNQAPQASQAPQPSGDPNAPITVTGQNPDTWHPHHAGVLGQIADYLLGTHFGKNNTRNNMEGALQHLTSNPMEAVKRMAMFDPDGAEKLWNVVTDNQRQQGSLDRQNKVYDGVNENLTYNRAAAAMSGATPQTWGPMREQILKMASSRGVNMEDLIPKEYDPTAIQTMQSGAVPMTKQVAVGEQVRNHNLQHGDRVSGQDIQKDRNDILRSQGGARIGIAEENAGTSARNADTAEFNSQTARARANTYAGLNQGRAVDSPAGPGVVDKTGNQLTVFTHDGRKLLYIRGGDKNHWKFAHQIIGKDEKAGGTNEPDAPDQN